MSLEADTGYGHPHPPRGGGVMRKKVAGVPVIYLALGVVVILAAYAYKAKSTTTTAANAAPDVPSTLGGDVYPGMPQGTVIVAPATTAPNGPSNSAIETNDQWLRAGVGILMKGGTGPGTAQEALQAYLNGNRLSYQQGAMRDAVISEIGIPPYPPDSGGTDPKTVDPTSSTVPVVPLPDPPIIPAVNTPTPVASNGYMAIYQGADGVINHAALPVQDASYANGQLLYTDPARPWLGTIQTADTAANRAEIARSGGSVVGGY